MFCLLETLFVSSCKSSKKLRLFAPACRLFSKSRFHGTKLLQKIRKNCRFYKNWRKMHFFFSPGVIFASNIRKIGFFFRDICSVILNRILLVCDANCCEILRICEILSNFAVD